MRFHLLFVFLYVFWCDAPVYPANFGLVELGWLGFMLSVLFCLNFYEIKSKGSTKYKIKVLPSHWFGHLFSFGGFHSKFGIFTGMTWLFFSCFIPLLVRSYMSEVNLFTCFEGRSLILECYYFFSTFFCCFEICLPFFLHSSLLCH